MDIAHISFAKTGYFSSLICDYLEEKKQLEPFYHRRPKLSDFKAQIQEKQLNFTKSHRTVLHKVLKAQYEAYEMSGATKKNIELLKEDTGFTIVTGHQLNLFTGPLYFLYKIISTINLTKKLKDKYPDYDFVPIYWMATEDHDFEEINYFNFKGKKMHWNPEVREGISGAVGELNTKGLEGVLEAFSKDMGGGDNAVRLVELFKSAYLRHDTLSEATGYLANELFGKYGLVIIDGADKNLKRLLIPYAKRDIFDKVTWDKVSGTVKKLEEITENYGIQVNPREINYFYLVEGLRERLIEKDGLFFVNDSEIQFSKEALLKELEAYPERFSPNVLARPLYQEVVLPNLCYIGGGGELAYWLELKDFFREMDVPFPILLLRNSALIITQKQAKKLRNLQVSIPDLFLAQSSLVNKKIREISNINIDLSPQRKHLEEQFECMYTLAEKTDPSFLGAVKAQEVKQIKGLKKLEKRLLKAQKRKLKDHVSRLTTIQNDLFPNKSLQERQINFSELYLELGEALIPMLLDNLDPLSGEFAVLSLD